MIILFRYNGILLLSFIKKVEREGGGGEGKAGGGGQGMGGRGGEEVEGEGRRWI